MKQRLLVVTGLFALVFASQDLFAGEVLYHLRANPFLRPVVEEPVQQEARVEQKPQHQIRLRGIMADGTDSLVNLDGTILGLGEIHEGLTLVSVAEDSAVFSKQDKLFTFTLNEGKGHDQKHD